MDQNIHSKTHKRIINMDQNIHSKTHKRTKTWTKTSIIINVMFSTHNDGYCKKYIFH